MAAQQHDLPKSESAEVETTIAHSSPGRLRLKIERGAIESGLAEEVVAAFDDQPGVVSARLNTAARSIVVHFDERKTDADALAKGLCKAGVTLSMAAPEAPAKETPRRTKFAGWVSQNTRSADERLLTASGGSVDLRTLLPVTLGILALREVLAGRVGSAPWYTLTWWAFDSFLKVRASTPLPINQNPE